ncbi:hypothetical protein RZS08_15990, partial [Arthrospira platensis SPKY1]|nr:hypothetical protein [Arthrospira platensis SPKY1]
MAFQLSPGVNTTEIDLTTRVPTLGVSEGAFVGTFSWGPLDEVTLIGSEDELVRRFGKPTNDTFTSFFSATNFLGYTNTLRLVRVANTKNAAVTRTFSGAVVSVDGLTLTVSSPQVAPAVR